MQTELVTSPDDKLQFSARHRPAMSAGDYTVQVTQTLNIAGSVQSFHSDVTKFAVFSSRFVLRAADIAAVYPPAESSSSYAEVLPHVILNRPTLPWERTCERASTAANARPWLALLVFSELELTGAVKQVKVSDLFASPAPSQPRFAHLESESGDPLNDSATVIEMPWQLLKQVLPAPDEMALVCHVRSVNYAKTGTTGQENSVVISSRLPPQNSRVFAHLVSLESCYSGSPLKFLGDPPNDGDIVRLVSLYSWQFFCQGDSAEDFPARMNQLAASAGRMHLPASTVQGAGVAKQQATAFLESGFIALPHRFRQGDSSVSWYHGPLLPGPSPAPADLANTLPTACADKLLLFNPQQGMLDVSYAAAWELGRMLTLENSLIADALFEFRRASVQAAIAKKQFDETGAALHLQPPGPGPEIPSSAQDWVSKRLGLFQGIPFNYLVPDEAYLPQESLRFFTIDQVWRQCLVDGALSVGRFAGKDPATVAADVQIQASLPKASSGLLLRSAVVEAFPGLLIEAYPAAPPAPSTQRLTMLRREALSPNILLVLFEGDASSFDFHLSPESMHFGVDHPDKNGVFHKTLRSTMTNSNIVEVPFRSQALSTVIDMWALATRILQVTRGTAPSDTDLPGFALEMIESIPVFRFSM